MIAAQVLAGKRVLVVDDDEQILQCLSRILRGSGCCVTAASSGNQALGLFVAGNFDLVISDVNMPDGDGFDLLEGIRAIGEKAPKVILASGFPKITQRRALELGAEAILQKPIRGEDLLALITFELGCEVTPGAPDGDSGAPKRSFSAERARAWLMKAGYLEIQGFIPLKNVSGLYGVELRKGGPYEAIVQIESEGSLAEGGGVETRYEEIFRWKLAKPETRKIVIAIPKRNGRGDFVALFDEEILC